MTRLRPPVPTRWSAIALLLLTPSCGDEVGRPHGAVCADDDACESGLCAAGMCIDPGSCADLWRVGMDDAALGPCAAALTGFSLSPDTFEGGGGDAFEVRAVGTFTGMAGTRHGADLSEAATFSVEGEGLATLSNGSPRLLTLLDGPDATGALRAVLGRGERLREATASIVRRGAAVPETCGDGFHDVATEACDTSSPSGNACQWPTPDCTENCICTNLCGNGVVDGVETCETTDACAADRVCRRCQCVLASIAAFVGDMNGDVGGPFERSLDVVRVELTLFGEGFTDLIVNIDASPEGLATSEEIGRVCLVVEDDEGRERLRSCVVGQNSTARRLEVAVDGGAPEDWSETSGLRSNGPSAYTLDGWGLGTPERSWSWRIETSVDGRIVDRVPDEGAMPWTDVVGL